MWLPRLIIGMRDTLAPVPRRLCSAIPRDCSSTLRDRLLLEAAWLLKKVNRIFCEGCAARQTASVSDAVSELLRMSVVRGQQSGGGDSYTAARMHPWHQILPTYALGACPPACNTQVRRDAPRSVVAWLGGALILHQYCRLLLACLGIHLTQARA